MRYLIILALIQALTPFAVSLAQEEDPPNVNWVRYYESMDMQGQYHWVNDIFAIPGGGYVLGGKVSLGINTKAAWLLVTDEGGMVAVDRVFDYPDDVVAFVDCYSVIKTDDGGYLMGGRTQLRDGVLNFDVIKANANGEMHWWSVFGEGSGWGCHALIELKGGNYVASGQSRDYQAFAVLMDENGNAIWENTYEGTWLFGIREVAGEGLLFAGYDGGGTALLLKTDFDGEVIWSNSFPGGTLWSLVSCPEGGFAACGQASRGLGYYLCRVDNNGDLLWDQNFPDINPLGIATGLAVMADGGFVLSGSIRSDQGIYMSATIRTDGQGNERWIRIADNLPHQPNSALAINYGSVVVKPDGSIVYGGNTRRIDGFQETRHEGVVVCLAADRSAPNIVEFNPETLFLTVLTGDSVLFSVRAEDLQDDSLMYIWTLDNAEVSSDTFAVITFEEFGLSDVKCVVSDGLLADSVMWRVEVRDFFVSAYTPPQPSIIVRRNTYHNFGVEVEAIDGLELFVNWTFTGRDRRQLIIGHEDTLAVYFPFAGENHLSVSIQGNQEVETVDWDIEVSSPVWYWWPHELALTVPVDTVMDFVIFPFNPESDSMEYRWELDGGLIEAVESEIELWFDEVGEHQVAAYATEGMLADTVIWSLIVEEGNAVIDDVMKPELAKYTELHSPVPNPFNAVVKLTIAVPEERFVQLEIFDTNGRKLTRLADGRFKKGLHNFIWKADSTPPGLYFALMKSEGVRQSKKLVLVK